MSTSPNHWPGRVVLFGMISLFLAMACALVSIAIAGKPGAAIFETGGKVFGFLWLPFVGIGAMMRMSEAREESRLEQKATIDQGEQADSSQAPSKIQSDRSAL